MKGCVGVRAAGSPRLAVDDAYVWMDLGSNKGELRGSSCLCFVSCAIMRRDVFAVHQPRRQPTRRAGGVPGTISASPPTSPLLFYERRGSKS